MSPLRRFLDAMSFFTCLVPGRLCSNSTLGECAPCIYPCGVATGLVATLVSWAFLWLATLAAPAENALLVLLLAGAAWSVAEILVTRGLHWDAVADLVDAVGSFKRGDAFRAVLKDSHIGTFGVLALMAVFVCQSLAAASYLSEERYLTLVLAPAWGKTMAMPLFRFGRPHDPKSLGGQFASAGTRGNFLLSLILVPVTVGLCLFDGAHVIQGLVLVALQALLALWFLRLSRIHGGYSGDFCGALMQFGQCLYLVLLV